MNLVIDTNVWIAALLKKDGASRQVIRLALLGEISPQISTSLFFEYESVMKRETIQKQCRLTIKEQEALFQAFLSTCVYNEIFYLWRPNLQDKNDDYLVELAVASNSELIVTENIKDLKSNELFFDFKVLTVKEFLQRSKS